MNDFNSGMWKPRLVILVALLLALIVLLFADTLDAFGQTPPHEQPHIWNLTAVYPNGNTENDPANFWCIKLHVHWDSSSYYELPDGRFVLTGTADELLGYELVFVSNGIDNHGSVAFVTSGAGQ